MKRIMNLLRGMVVLSATGPFPERLLNLCAQEGVDFWKLSWLDAHTIRFTTRRETLGRLRKLASRGLPDFLMRFRHRYTFLLGLVLALVAVMLLSRFVLVIQVEGNERVPTARILQELRRQGVRPGVFGPGVDCRQVAQASLLHLEDLSFMAVNLHGTRLQVIVRETIPLPEKLDESGFYDIVARADGIVLHVEAEQGEAAVQNGDTVRAGDLLISGTMVMEPPKYSDLPIRTYETHARGRILARTWRTLEAVMPIPAPVKNLTGETRTLWALELAGVRIPLLGRRDEEGTWDSQETVWQWNLPGGIRLPLALQREQRRRYERTEAEPDREAAREMLEESLRRRLEEVIGEDGSVESTAFQVTEADGLLKVTLQAECQEEIGREIPGTGQIPEQKTEDG